jgi:hypothetical protein
MSFLLLSHAISKSTETRFSNSDQLFWAGIAALPSLATTVAPLEHSASGLRIGV